MRRREAAAAVGQHHAQFRQAFQHAAEGQAAGGARLLGRHADQPRHPVFRHAGHAHHVPRVHQHRGAEIGGGLEEREQFRRVEIPVAAVRADLHALQAQFVDAAFQFAHRQRRRLQRHRADAGVVARIVAAHAGHVVVQMAMQLQRLVARRPVREQHRHGGDHLHVDAETGVVVDACLRIERRVPYLAEELAVLVDAVAPIGMGHHRKAVVAVLGRQVRPVTGQDVRVGIDLEHPRSVKPPRGGVALRSHMVRRGYTCGCSAAAADVWELRFVT